MSFRIPRQARLDMRLTPGLDESGLRPITASVMLHDTRRIYMVRPVGAPKTGPGLIFPQEKAKPAPIDLTYGDLFYRGLLEEVNLNPDDVTPHPWSLVQYHNPIPARRGKPRMIKIMYVFAAYVDEAAVAKMRPKPSEIQEVVAVEGPDFLSVLPNRERKFTGSVEACTRAVEAGMLLSEQWGFMLPRPART